jgi:predicted O-methyltransferase YrrM
MIERQTPRLADAVAATTFHATPQFYDPVLLSAAALLRRASRADASRAVIDTLERLTPDDYSRFVTGYLRRGLELAADDWVYADLLTVLHAAATLLRPDTYLEIGVRRGRSLGIVAAAAPQVRIWGFDLWIPEYAGMPNPGPSFVRDEVARLAPAVDLTLVSGDSRVTVPDFFEAHPDLRFDLVTVDGDHSREGAAADLAHVIPRVKAGGVLTFDDIAHPQHPWLAEVWRDLVVGSRQFDCAAFGELGFGVAVAVRRGSA